MPTPVLPALYGDTVLSGDSCPRYVKTSRPVSRLFLFFIRTRTNVSARQQFWAVRLRCAVSTFPVRCKDRKTSTDSCRLSSMLYSGL